MVNHFLQQRLLKKNMYDEVFGDKKVDEAAGSKRYKGTEGMEGYCKIKRQTTIQRVTKQKKE